MERGKRCKKAVNRKAMLVKMQTICRLQVQVKKVKYSNITAEGHFNILKVLSKNSSNIIQNYTCQSLGNKTKRHVYTVTLKSVWEDLCINTLIDRKVPKFANRLTWQCLWCRSHTEARANKTTVPLLHHHAVAIDYLPGCLNHSSWMYYMSLGWSWHFFQSS